MGISIWKKNDYPGLVIWLLVPKQMFFYSSIFAKTDFKWGHGKKQKYKEIFDAKVRKNEENQVFFQICPQILSKDGGLTSIMKEHNSSYTFMWKKYITKQ